MTVETLRVPRAAFDMENPWSAPPECTPVPLCRATDGAPPRLETTVAVWYDEDYLSVLFSGADDHVVASHVVHDAPLYEEDVVEIFVAPEEPGRYYEIEVNPLGTLFDAAIESPDGVRATMRADRGWTCEGLHAVLRRVSGPGGATTADTLVRIPFFALERSTPGEGETWRVNFFRIDRHPARGDEFSAWRPTWKTPADFHVPAAFGTLLFR